MSLMYTPAGEIGFAFPEFQLTATDGKIYQSTDFLNKRLPIVVMFLCNHCPYVQAIEDRLIQLAGEYQQTVQFIGICSNDAADYPEDGFEQLKLRAEQKHYPFPYLHDESQSVAKSFAAVCTPDLYVFDARGTLTYRGRLDDSWRDTNKVRKRELQLAIDATIHHKTIPPEQQNPSMGCSIKWKSC